MWRNLTYGLMCGLLAAVLLTAGDKPSEDEATAIAAVPVPVKPGLSTQLLHEIKTTAAPAGGEAGQKLPSFVELVQVPAQDSVDSPRSKRAVVRLKNSTVQNVSATAARHFAGVAGVQIVADSVGNRLLISAPAELLEEVLKTVAELDPDPTMVAVEVMIVEFPPIAADDGAPNAGHKAYEVRDFAGPTEKVRDRLQDLSKAGKLHRYKRFSVSSVNNRTTLLQETDDRPGAGSAESLAAAPRAGSPFSGTGTTVQFTARAAGDHKVTMEIVVHDVPAGANASALDAPPGRPAKDEKSEPMESKFLGTLSILTGHTVVASEIEGRGTPGRSQVVILVSARIVVAESAPPAAPGSP